MTHEHYTPWCIIQLHNETSVSIRAINKVKVFGSLSHNVILNKMSLPVLPLELKLKILTLKHPDWNKRQFYRTMVPRLVLSTNFYPIILSKLLQGIAKQGRGQLLAFLSYRDGRDDRYVAYVVLMVWV